MNKRRCTLTILASFMLIAEGCTALRSIVPEMPWAKTGPVPVKQAPSDTASTFNGHPKHSAIRLDGKEGEVNIGNGKVISWTPETQPANVAFALDEKTSGPFLLHVKADGVYIESGLVLFIR